MNREVIRCTRCRLVMFRGNREKCPRCLWDLEAAPTMPVIVRPQPVPAPAAPATIGERVRTVRRRCKVSQRDLAKRMGCPRTWISKIECGRTDPVMQSALRLAGALGCDLGELFPVFVPMRHGALGDPGLVDFMAEVYKHAGLLTNEQWIAVRRKARELMGPKCAQVVIADEEQSEAG